MTHDDPSSAVPVTTQRRRALLTNEFMPAHGGAERLLHQRAREFQPEGVMVFAPHTEGCETFDAQQPYAILRAASPWPRLPAWRDLARSLWPALRLYREHRRQPFELIECGQNFPASLFAYVIHRVHGTPYLVWIHGNDLIGPARYRLLRFAIRRALDRAAAVITNSRYTADLIAAFGVPEARIRIIEPVVDTTAFHPAAPSPALLRRYGLGTHKVLLSVCRLVRRKGVDLVIEALPGLIRRHPEVRYVVVGDGPVKAELQTLARRRGLADHVVFAGRVPDQELPAHYNLASVFVMPSRRMDREASVEGLGLVYLEAMASALPVVAGRSGGVPDIVHEGDNGLLVTPDSVPELAQALETLLADDTYARRLGENGLAFVRRPRDWRVLVV